MFFQLVKMSSTKLMPLSVVTNIWLNVPVDIARDLKDVLSRHRLHDFESNFARCLYWHLCFTHKKEKEVRYQIDKKTILFCAKTWRYSLTQNGSWTYLMFYWILKVPSTKLMMLSIVTKTGLNILIGMVCDLKGVLGRHKLHNFESNFARCLYWHLWVTHSKEKEVQCQID